MCACKRACARVCVRVLCTSGRSWHASTLLACSYSSPAFKTHHVWLPGVLVVQQALHQRSTQRGLAQLLHAAGARVGTRCGA